MQLWLGILLFIPTMASASFGEVPSKYREVAQSHGIPADIFYAIALQESQRFLGEGVVRPWPWTLNVRGKAERFATKTQAYQRLLSLVRQGVRNIDVGLMQVNLRWNGHRFYYLADMIDPLRNLITAAEILKEHYNACSNWECAVGRYHKPGNDPKSLKLSTQYANSVMKLRHKIWSSS